jgi:integrase
LSDAVRWGLPARNVAALAHGSRVERAEITPLFVEQSQEFLAAVERHRLEAFFCTAIATGLRLGELHGLRWADIDTTTGAAFRPHRDACE